jgi:hypothetical protein
MTKFSKDDGREESPAPQDGVHRTRFSDKMNRDERGLHCRKCGCRDWRVVYTRDRMRGIRRLRACRNCGHRLVTFEQPAQG